MIVDILSCQCKAMSAVKILPVYRVHSALDDRRKRHNFRSVKCAWSSTNQIAFTSHCLGDRTESSNNELNDEHFVQIVDPNRPWDLQSIKTDHAEVISHLKWSPSASHFLTVDCTGVFKLWGMKNCLINEWKCEQTYNIGEKIVCVSWIGTSTKYLYGEVTKDLGHLMSMGDARGFPRNKAKHPLSYVRGMSGDGWIAVTEAAKVYFFGINADHFPQETIDTDLQGVQVGDIAFSNDGQIILGLSDGTIGSVARFYAIKLNCMAKNKITISSSALQTLSPHANILTTPFSITHIKFVFQNSGSHVLICSKGLVESSVERWQLTTEEQQLHELFHKQQMKPSPIKIWECVSVNVLRKTIVDIAVPWLPLEPEKSQNISYPRHNIILGFSDGNLMALNSFNLRQVEGEYKDLESFTSSPLHPAKRLKTSYYTQTCAFLALHYSPCSCCIVGITGNGSLYLFKCEQDEGISHIPNSVAFTNLLKYCLLSDWQSWDIFIVLKHQPNDILDATLRLFEQELPASSSLYQSKKFLSIKASLLSLYPDSHNKASDCHSKQFLLALENFFKSLVPVGAERLSGFCEQPTDVDLAMTLQNLDPKEFEVDADVLVTLTPLIQWLADFASKYVGVLFVKQGNDLLPAASLRYDNHCILLLKQMLLLVIIWSKQSSRILPYCIGPIEKQDYIVQLFKLMSKLWMVNHQKLDVADLEKNVSELESYFTNHLSFLYQSMIVSSTNQGIIGQQSYLNPNEPDVYEYGQKPRERMLPLRLLTSQYNGDVDVVSKFLLGNDSGVILRRCTRCNGLSQLPQTKEKLENIWEQKWTKFCICGGAWKLAKSN
ncbi:mediator of RNA polymerase II transcription subunit 16-like isoform X2 [Xenia sp. Carnegie-2017]|uniref:mediator of RNA polymerase II transcription subunit 16-like isoform X2 n=1 Tax=Xenia sp. Carnegie-2017 TaxID=2897299 RepID=UPI001F035996|nr:mediator of RNA polymerase II transcription subunit 16-like isoform X2 [Xenia sp. Carnegie-2017]